MQPKKAKEKVTTEVDGSPTISEILSKKGEDTNGANKNVRVAAFFLDSNSINSKQLMQLINLSMLFRRLLTK